MELAAGAGFYRDLGLERLFRDVQGARYHPLRGSAQLTYTGRVALGLDVNGRTPPVMLERRRRHEDHTRTHQCSGSVS